MQIGRDARREDADGTMTQDPPAYPVDRDGSQATSIGTRARALRMAQNLTIADVAQRSGLSSGIISQIERGKSNPSIRTLQRLRAALGVNLWEFLQSEEPETVEDGLSAERYIRRKADRQNIVVGSSHLVKELLSPKRDENLRFMLITVPPFGESEDVLQGQGQKGGLILSGRAALTIDGSTRLLETGDSFQFPSELPHKISNPHDEPTQLLWIMSIMDVHL